MTKEQFEELGYIVVRQLQDGRWIGVIRMIFTTGLCIGLHAHGYSGRYCYDRLYDAVEAAKTYTGEGDPSGPWIKYKGHNGERSHPQHHEEL